MSCKTIGPLKYCLLRGAYIVGDNMSSNICSAIDQSYSGDVVIEKKVDDMDVTEIGINSFWGSQATNITIKANIQSIGSFAFMNCPNLKYINIPSSVTFIGEEGLNIGAGGRNKITTIIEFNTGRKEPVYLSNNAISGRETLYIIYPSTIRPICKNNYGVNNFNTLYICAPRKFTFCGEHKTTTYLWYCKYPKMFSEPPPVICRSCGTPFGFSYLFFLSVFVSE